MPIGSKGISMVDARDLAAVAALKLIEREQAEQPLPRETIELAGPTAMTGESAAAIWSEVLGRSVAYAGDDLPAFETTLKQAGPGWTAYDMRMMCAAFQQYRMQASATTLNTLVGLLGRPLRTYREFAEETAKAWCNT
ncbi:MAG TPA: hypothetical protein VFL97_08780 [Nitrococcus sp.]|nr:hypothetical protein [Nitrococcus sp.]